MKLLSRVRYTKPHIWIEDDLMEKLRQLDTENVKSRNKQRNKIKHADICKNKPTYGTIGCGWVRCDTHIAHKYGQTLTIV